VLTTKVDDTLSYFCVYATTLPNTLPPLYGGYVAEVHVFKTRPAHFSEHFSKLILMGFFQFKKQRNKSLHQVPKLWRRLI